MESPTTEKPDFICSDFSCLEVHRNQSGVVEGVFRIYTPNTSGKGANYMFWDWEVLLADSIAIPVVHKNEKLDLSVYKGKKVSIQGNIFHGIVIGGSKPEEQSATGYRIDAASIQLKK